MSSFVRLVAVALAVTGCNERPRWSSSPHASLPRPLGETTTAPLLAYTDWTPPSLDSVRVIDTSTWTPIFAANWSEAVSPYARPESLALTADGRTLLVSAHDYASGTYCDRLDAVDLGSGVITRIPLLCDQNSLTFAVPSRTPVGADSTDSPISCSVHQGSAKRVTALRRRNPAIDPAAMPLRGLGFSGMSSPGGTRQAPRMDSHSMRLSISSARSARLRRLSFTLALALAACGGGSSSSGTGAHSIRGSITLAGSAAAGVTVTLSGAGSASTRSDAAGLYAFADLADGSYSVTPSCDGCAFDPSAREVALSGADAAGLDFTGTAPGLTWGDGSWDHVVWQ